FFLAGLFHDIGKITTPVEILEKKGKLEPWEMDIMRKHVYYSYIILKNHQNEPWFWPAVRHQERIDGSGYPWKLKGEKMTFKDKILQVADYFVAVLEPRPYRGPNTPEKAYKEVSRAVENGTLDKGPANILKELVYGGYDFEKMDFMSSIQREIYDFEKSLMEG
ncbi:MAG: HD-GYP domain-containing protein, partial [Fervidobacterium sp.]